MSSGFLPDPSFLALRENFLMAATGAGAILSEYPHPLRGPFGEALATDVALLGNPGAKRVLVALSGTHGVEGYYGSTCQTQWLQEFDHSCLSDDVAVLMIHLINPWGTAWMRRVNEENIDLNRNYLDFSRPLPHNEQYEILHNIYNCRELEGPERRRANAMLEAQIATQGWSAVMAIVEAGQYTHADGLFYGGQAASWSNQTLHAIVMRHLARAEIAMCFDLHTGAGAYGHPMLMTIAQAPYPALNDARRCYGPWLYTLLTGHGCSSNTGVAATATGYTSQALLDALPQLYLMPFVIECGTFEGEQIHNILRDDQWLHLYGDPFDQVGRQIKRALLEQFWPCDQDWQETVWLRTRHIWKRALAFLQMQQPGVAPFVDCTGP